MNQALSMTTGWRGLTASALAVVVLVSAGCSTTRVSAPAPVEDRGFSRPDTAAARPGAENAGKPGYHTVKAGDTVYRIALDNGQNWRDIAAWNNLANPGAIEIGQVLRVAPPVAAAPAAPVVAAAPVTSSGVVGRPLSETSSPAPAPAPAPAAAPAPAPAPAPAASEELLTAAQTMSPAVRRAVLEHGVDPSTIKGTGKDGRLTKEDVIAAVYGPASAKAASSVQAASCVLAAGSVQAASCPVVQNHNKQRDILGSNFIGRTSFVAMNYNPPLGPFSESIVICTICYT